MKLLLKSLALISMLVGSMPAGADLIAHWPLDTDSLDATGNGHHGSVIGGSVNFSQPGANAATGQSATFPDNGHIDIPWNQALNPQSFTIALWANPASTGGYASPITSRDDVQGGVTTHGFIDDCSGVPISSTGQRFHIDQATVWNLLDDNGNKIGQAATFAQWTKIQDQSNQRNQRSSLLSALRVLLPKKLTTDHR